MKRIIIPFKLLLVVLALAGAKHEAMGQAAAVKADRIFIHGTILTVDSTNSVAEAIAIKDGRILAVGSNTAIGEFKGDGTQVEDLKGKVLLPGFVDGHSHILDLGEDDYANLASPPMGTVRDIPDLISALKDFQGKHKIPKGEWIYGYGYDQDQLAEKRHPVKEDLDAAFPDNPVAIVNINGHMQVVNSYALKISGIDSNTQDPAGGFIVRKPGSREPAGLLQEAASRLLKRSKPKVQTLDQQFEALKKKQLYYAGLGITTAQDGYTSLNNVRLLEKAAAANALVIDIAALPAYPILDTLLADPAAYPFGSYNNHLKLEGFKIISDGSPQGRTAYFTKPYTLQLPGDTAGYRGFPDVDQQDLNAAILKGFEHGLQPYVHCNGDAAIDQYINAVEYADSVLGTTAFNRRPVVIHSQFVRPDQLDKYKTLGFLPSFFTSHTFFWGDVHTRNLGKERAWFTSPLKAALDKGIVFTDHSDFPVTPVNPLFILWTAVNRLSRTNVVIGPDQRITPEQGLRALTINGAYEYFEEKTKGSLEKGKVADLVVLSGNPLSVQAGKIKDIKVLETIKDGKTIYKKQ